MNSDVNKIQTRLKVNKLTLNVKKMLYLIYNSNEQQRFLTQWKAITMGKGRGSEGKKGQF